MSEKEKQPTVPSQEKYNQALEALLGPLERNYEPGSVEQRENQLIKAVLWRSISRLAHQPYSVGVIRSGNKKQCEMVIELVAKLYKPDSLGIVIPNIVDEAITSEETCYDPSGNESDAVLQSGDDYVMASMLPGEMNNKKTTISDGLIKLTSELCTNYIKPD